MKQLVIVLVLIAGVHMTSTAQDSKTKVDGSEYKKKSENKGTHHTAMYSQGVHRSYPAHHYTHHYYTHHYYRHRPVHHMAYRRHVYHRHVAYHRKHTYGKPVAHYKKVKVENRKGEYKAKT